MRQIFLAEKVSTMHFCHCILLVRGKKKSCQEFQCTLYSLVVSKESDSTKCLQNPHDLCIFLYFNTIPIAILGIMCIHHTSVFYLLANNIRVSLCCTEAWMRASLYIYYPLKGEKHLSLQ